MPLDIDPARQLPRIYIYELPAMLGLDMQVHACLLLNFDRADWTFRTGAGIQLIESILASPWRVTDPTKADVFFIPVASDFIVRDVVARYLAARWPFWNATSAGANHIWYPFIQDYGRWWYLHDRPFEAGERQTGNSIGLSHHGRKMPCDGICTFLEGRDIVISSWDTVPSPPCLARPGGCFAIPSTEQDLARLRAEKQQGYKFYFAGSVSIVEGDGQWSMWKGNTRQLLLNFSAVWARPDYFVSTRVDRLLFDSQMANATFCFAPPGTHGGWGIRGEMAILYGCIPVMLNPDWAERYEELLPYESFSVRLPYQRIAELPALLDTYSDARIDAMRREIACLYRWFASITINNVVPLESILMILRDRKRFPERAASRTYPLDSTIRSVCDDLLPRFRLT